MAGFIKISEAASLALHSMVYISSREEATPVNDISEYLGVSEFHLSKVMQRLAKSRLVKSTRGPKGGFILNKKNTVISLLDIYEAIDGPIDENNCLLNHESCKRKRCILGKSLANMSSKFRDYLKTTRLSEIMD